MVRQRQTLQFRSLNAQRGRSWVLLSIWRGFIGSQTVRCAQNTAQTIGRARRQPARGGGPATSCICCSIPSSIARSEKRKEAALYPAAARERPLEGCATRTANALARVSGSPGGTKIPFTLSST